MPLAALKCPLKALQFILLAPRPIRICFTFPCFYWLYLVLFRSPVAAGVALGELLVAATSNVPSAATERQQKKSANFYMCNTVAVLPAILCHLEQLPLL
jgi:hypothetical protein